MEYMFEKAPDVLVIAVKYQDGTLAQYGFKDPGSFFGLPSGKFTYIQNTQDVTEQLRLAKENLSPADYVWNDQHYPAVLVEDPNGNRTMETETKKRLYWDRLGALQEGACEILDAARHHAACVNGQQHLFASAHPQKAAHRHVIGYACCFGKPQPQS